jgi:hypothetical protein
MNGYAQRIFFWNEGKDVTGVVLLLPGKTLHISRLRTLIQKVVADQTFRDQYRRELNFPLERHYVDYGAFPEEQP